ncbi:MAG: hypothetical protein F6K25_22570 [Okeania sp. SIO2G4]|uniref:hypothetical protein n=1 Tax=unclassified Okeania TaxID=2634635 RepID=UPI0013B989C8|nr:MULTISPECIES: hypothetical protein [unclassified Okeania]NEP74483.1 hypothetical protein [Okeania sp. SIO2G5]NEP97094.1 hypothetical protein [Okeania sp. SIO2F5]NEQ93297.1 hypothetical protein [Okeania sp. SIO2G4]
MRVGDSPLTPPRRGRREWGSRGDYIKSGSIGVIRWGDGEMGRWGDGEMGSERNIW